MPLKALKKLSLIVVVSLFFGFSCHKDDRHLAAPFSGYPLTIKEVMAPGDNFISPIPYPTVLMLKADLTWTMDIAGTITSGTYTWQTLNSITGKIQFTVQQWPATNAAKLKAIVEAVNKCEFPVVVQNPEVLFSIEGGNGYMKTDR